MGSHSRRFSASGKESRALRRLLGEVRFRREAFVIAIGLQVAFTLQNVHVFSHRFNQRRGFGVETSLAQLVHFGFGEVLVFSPQRLRHARLYRSAPNDRAWLPDGRRNPLQLQLLTSDSRLKRQADKPILNNPIKTANNIFLFIDKHKDWAIQLILSHFPRFCPVNAFYNTSFTPIKRRISPHNFFL